jgi:hypothetical protein
VPFRAVSANAWSRRRCKTIRNYDPAFDEWSKRADVGHHSQGSESGGRAMKDMCWYIQSFEVYPKIWHLLGRLPAQVPLAWEGTDDRNLWKWFGKLQHRAEAQ